MLFHRWNQAENSVLKISLKLTASQVWKSDACKKQNIRATFCLSLQRGGAFTTGGIVRHPETEKIILPNEVHMQ